MRTNEEGSTAAVEGGQGVMSEQFPFLGPCCKVACKGCVVADQGIVEGAVSFLPLWDSLSGSAVIAGSQDERMEPFSPEQFTPIIDENLIGRRVEDNEAAITVIIEQACR